MLVFEYCSYIIALGGNGAPAILRIAFAVYLQVALPRFPVDARNSAVSAACIDPWLSGNGRGVYVSLPSKTLPEFDDTDLL